MRPPPPNRLVVALDRTDPEEAIRLAGALAGEVGLLKVGLELFVANGPDVVRRVREHAPVFLDLKLHDIPATVEGAARAAGRLAVDLLTVHALGGPAMVAAAVRGSEAGAAEVGVEPPSVIAVTVLSSVAGEALASSASLAFEAVAAGAAGCVVSGEDVGEVRQVLGEDAVLVVPGIRPEGSRSNEHVRVLSPEEAVRAGADYLVVGRPITGAPDPAATARGIMARIR